jgi:glucans biosynthesis protein C
LRNLVFNSGPLWFVEILLIFSAVYALGRALLDWAKSRQGNSSVITDAKPKPLTHRTILAFILILAPFSFLTRVFFPLDTAWHNLQFSMFHQYILLFAAGILAYRREWLPDLPSGIRKVWSIVALVCVAILPLAMVLIGGGGDEGQSNSGLTALAMILSAWEAVYCVSMGILLLSLFRRRFDFQGSLGRLLSKNAYTVYIIHAAVIVGIAWMLREISLYPLLKYLLVAPVAVGLCFLISQLLRHIPLADKVL